MLLAGLKAIRLRILVVDDHEAVRKGVCAIVQTLEELRPDLVIMDITMPVVDGFKATRLIRELLPDSSVLLLSMHDGTNMRNVAMSAGAYGFVCKDQAAAVLRRAVEAVSRKQRFFPE